MSVSRPDLFNTISGARRVPLAVAANDDPDLALIGYSDPLHGRLELIDGLLRYTPGAGFFGVDAFSYRTVSEVGFETSAAVTINVAEPAFQPQSVLDDRIAETLPVSGRTIELRQVALLLAPDGVTRLRANDIVTFEGRTFIAAQGSAQTPASVLELIRGPDDAYVATPFFDLAAAATAASGRAIAYGGPGGLRSIAFHPDHARNGLLYASFAQVKPASPADFTYLSNAEAALQIDSVLAEWRIDPATGRPDPASYREVFRIGAPVFSHLIGDIGFDPFATPGDETWGLLYVASGDASGAAALEGGGLRDDALGKILRVDPTLQPDGAPFAAPAGNPFLGVPGMPDAVWSIGHRNPASFSFALGPDGRSRLIVVEIGRDNVEEVNIIEAGGNYGWSEREGPFALLNDRSGAVTGVAPLPGDEANGGRTYPAALVGHDDVVGGQSEGIATTAGIVVSNGSALDGQFLFADFARQGRFYHVDFDGMLRAKTRLSPDPAAAEGPEDLSWATPSLLTILLDHDGDPATAPLVRSTLGDAFGTNRNDVRMGAGPQGELLLTSKVNGRVYVATSTRPPDPAGVVEITAEGREGAAFAVYADGRFLGEVALGAPLAGGEATGLERFVFISPDGATPARVEIAALAPPEGAPWTDLRVDAVAFGGVVHGAGLQGRFAPVAPGQEPTGDGRLPGPGSLIFGALAAPPALRIEAEDFALGPSVNIVPDAQSSGGGYVQTARNAEGWIRTIFTGPTAFYDIGVNHYDENDGLARAELRVNGAPVEAWIWDRADGSPFAGPDSLTVRTIADVRLATGDEVELRTVWFRNEPARVDSFDFTFVRQAFRDPIRIEAETFELVSNARVEVIGVRTETPATVLRAASSSGPTVARRTLDVEPGRYEVSVGYYDESDGASRLTVRLGEAVLDDFLWDANLAGSPLAEPSTFVRRSLGAALVNPGDVLELSGFRDGVEPLRIDFVELLRLQDDPAL